MVVTLQRKVPAFDKRTFPDLLQEDRSELGPDGVRVIRLYSLFGMSSISHCVVHHPLHG
jgi:hypothetical protein